MKYLIAILLVCFCACITWGQTKTIAERLGYPKDAKLVIIHADDLGVSHSENAASIAAMEKGCVSSASIMVPCPWFPEIAAYAQANPAADLGLHITLTSEWKYYKWGPVTAKEKVPGLVNKNGFFYSSVDSVLQNANAAEVEQEIRNQVLRAKQFGMDPTHLDAHMGTALSGLDFFRAYLKVGREFKIPVFIPKLVELPLKYLIIHTAYDDAEMRAVTIDHPDWGAAWRQEDFNFFSSAECTKLLKDNNVYVITWKEIRDKIVRK